MTKVIHIKNAPKDWEYDSNYVYIGRSGARFGALKGYYGNPYSHKKDSVAQYIVKSVDEAVQKYEEYFYKRIAEDEDFKNNIEKLRGKTLICFCKVSENEPCHGDVIAEWLSLKKNNEY